MFARVVYLALALGSSELRRAIVVSLGIALSGCSAGDAGVPWDTAQMAQETADDLR